MAQNTIDDLSETFSSNLDFLGQSMQGGANANTIDTVFQKFAALIARFYSDLGGTGTVGGTANAITFTSASTYTSLTTGLIVAFKAASANTGATTFKLDGLATKDIKIAGDTDLGGSEVAANGVYLLRYDTALDGGSGAWVLLNPTIDAKWTSKAIGEIYFAPGTAANGYDHPPKAGPGFRYVLLTAGEDGVGEYNEGILTGESVSGTDPLVVATAVISLSGSPLNGRTINLINSEGRYLRASTSPGTVQNDASQGHRHLITASGHSRRGSTGASTGGNWFGSSGDAIDGGIASVTSGDPATDGTNGTPRTANETRVKNLQGVAYMRIK